MIICFCQKQKKNHLIRALFFRFYRRFDQQSFTFGEIYQKIRTVVNFVDIQSKSECANNCYWKFFPLNNRASPLCVYSNWYLVKIFFREDILLVFRYFLRKRRCFFSLFRTTYVQFKIVFRTQKKKIYIYGWELECFFRFLVSQKYPLFRSLLFFYQKSHVFFRARFVYYFYFGQWSIPWSIG
jgi:hypothetical protein